MSPLTAQANWSVACAEPPAYRARALPIPRARRAPRVHPRLFVAVSAFLYYHAAYLTRAPIPVAPRRGRIWVPPRVFKHLRYIYQLRKPARVAMPSPRRSQARPCAVPGCSNARSGACPLPLRCRAAACALGTQRQPGNRRSSELPSVTVALAVSRVGALRRLTACTQSAPQQVLRSRSCCLPHRNVNPGQCPVRGHFAAFRPLATALPAPLLP